MSSIELMLSNPTALYDFSTRAKNFLKNERIETVIQLLAFDEGRFKRSAHVGKSIMAELHAFHDAHDLKMGSASNLIEYLGYARQDLGYGRSAEIFKKIADDEEFKILDKSNFIAKSEILALVNLYLRKDALVEVSVVPLVQDQLPDDMKALSRKFLSAALDTPEFRARIEKQLGEISQIAAAYIAETKLTNG